MARDKLLNTFEPFAGELVGESLKDMGVDMHLGIIPISAVRSNRKVMTDPPLPLPLMKS